MAEEKRAEEQRAREAAQEENRRRAQLARQQGKSAPPPAPTTPEYPDIVAGASTLRFVASLASITGGVIVALGIVAAAFTLLNALRFHDRPDSDDYRTAAVAVVVGGTSSRAPS